MTNYSDNEFTAVKNIILPIQFMEIKHMPPVQLNWKETPEGWIQFFISHVWHFSAYSSLSQLQEILPALVSNKPSQLTFCRGT